MTRGKLLDNDTQLFIFISILIMTRKTENRTDSRNGVSRKNSYNLLNGKACLGLLPVKIQPRVQLAKQETVTPPGLTSGLQGSVNVHRGALMLVPQC